MNKNETVRAVALRPREITGALFATAMLSPFIVVSGVLAQSESTTSGPVSEARSANKQGGSLEEVVVTANRREERLIDVGASVAAVSGTELRQERVEQVRDLFVRLPNTDVKEYWPGIMPVITIRGVGLDDLSTTNNPAAGVYVDEAPLSSLALMNTEFYDLERVEVVKGPQGTLYGRNSTAGAINIISAKPRDKFEAYAGGGYGNYDTFTAEAMVNAPLSDTVRLRISGKGVDGGPMYKSDRLSNGQKGEDNGTRGIALGRAQLMIEPNSVFDLNLKVEDLHNRSLLGVPQGEGVPFTDPDPNPYRGAYPYKFPYRSDQLTFEETAHVHFNDMTLTSVSNYIKFQRHFYLDGDGVEAFIYHANQEDKVRQFTQELRLEGESKVVDWLVGAFYSWDNIKVLNHTDAPGLAAGFSAQLNVQVPLVPGTGMPLGDLLFGVPANLTVDGTANQTTRSYANFVTGTWHLPGKLDLITGLRYTHEKRSFTGGTDWTPALPSIGINDGFNPGQTITDNNWSYRLQLNYQLMENTLLYAGVSQGVKSGGFYSETVTSSQALRPYKPETLRAYEAGLKVQRELVTFNTAAFYYDYKKMQTLISAPDVASGTTFESVGNIPKVKIYGAEVEGAVRPINGLTLSLSGAYLHARLGAFTAPSGPVPAGLESPNAPKVSVAGSIRYEIPVGTWTVAPSVSARYSSSYFRDATNNPHIKVDSYTLMDGNIVASDADNLWEVTLWGKNLTDKHIVQSAQDVAAFGILLKTYNMPRTYGVTVMRHF